MSAYEFFTTQLVARERRSPHLVRLTFRGEQLRNIADHGYDQRIKIVIPRAGGHSLDQFPTGADWFARWRQTARHLRANIRTYTVAGVRQHCGEVDVDFVDHGATGPGSRLAVEARIGSEVGIFGPTSDQPVADSGLEFRHALAATSRQLVVGDLTALPAIRNITAQLPRSATGFVCLVASDKADHLTLSTPDGVETTWCTDEAAQHDAVRDWLAQLPPLPGDHAATNVLIDDDADGYWEVSAESPPDSVPGVSAWIAGESGQVRSLRRMLVDDFDIPRAAVAFMGYWRHGVASAG